MLFAMVTLSPPAAACSCVGEHVEPFSPGFVNVPTNAVIRTVGEDVAPKPREIYEDGVLRTDVVNELAQHGTTFVLTQRTEKPFRLGAIVEVRAKDDVQEPGIEPGASFTLEVVEEADETPPTWDGSYVVDHHRTGPIAMTSCGRSWGHSFAWLEMTDDVWTDSELLVIAVPHDTDHAEFVGDGEAAFVGEGACSHDDPTLKSDFHRTYDLFVEDGSGNRTGPFEIDTRACGCASPPAPFGGAGLLVTISLAAYCLRRSRIHARRPPSFSLPPRLLEG